MGSACSAPSQHAVGAADKLTLTAFFQVSPPPAYEKTVQQLREERIAPLRQALNDSIARHTQATGVREALEAEVRGGVRRGQRGPAASCSSGRRQDQMRI
jgi:hypothetical protein